LYLEKGEGFVVGGFALLCFASNRVVFKYEFKLEDRLMIEERTQEEKELG